MALTDAKIRGLKARPTSYKVSDALGLHIFVATSGSKLWRMAYRYLGKQKTLAFGKYPEMSLLEARRARDDAKRVLAKRIDPSASKRAEKRERLVAAENTFKAVADEWFDINKGRWVETYASRLRSRLNQDLIPEFGRRPPAEMDRAVVEAVEFSISNGSKVVLQTMEASKFGWRAPSDACVEQIVRRWTGRGHT